MTTPGDHPIHDTPASGTGRDPRPLVAWFPRFFLLEAAAGLLVLAGFGLLAMMLDAPLLSIADPSVTPDPSKAPWYFVGLQELLHYYPPLVSAVVVPAAAVALLLAAPYLGPGLGRPLWVNQGDGTRRALRLGGVLVALLAALAATANHVPWVLVVPTAVVGLLAIAPGLGGPRGWPLGWLARRSALDWIAVWIAVEAVLLSVIGALFRGPGWSWTWPWLEGVY